MALLCYLLIQVHFVQLMAQKGSLDNTLTELQHQLNKKHDCYRVGIKGVNMMPIDLTEKDTVLYFYDIRFRNRGDSQEMVLIGKSELIYQAGEELFYIKDSSASRRDSYLLMRYFKNNDRIKKALSIDSLRLKFTITHTDTIIGTNKYTKVLFVEKFKEVKTITLEPTAYFAYYVFNEVGIKEVYYASKQLGFDFNKDFRYDYCRENIMSELFDNLVDSIMQIWKRLDAIGQEKALKTKEEGRLERNKYYSEPWKDSTFCFKLAKEKFNVYGGGEVAFNDFSSRFVFLDFWYASCYPCILSFDEMKEIYEYAKTEPLVDFLAINSTDNDYRIKFMADKFNINYPIATDSGHFFGKEYWLAVHPTFMLLDLVEQKVVFYQQGYGKRGALLERVKEEIEKYKLKEN